ncbi:MAG: sulfatase-like hydrolase/transferase, partial [bacterium]
RDWFCFIHLIDPHVPYTPPPSTRSKFTDPEYEGPYKNDFRAIEEWKSGLVKPEEKDIKQVKGLYEAEVANVDEALGDLFSFLSMSGLMDETLIIFGADHGEEFYEHGAFEHGHTMYEEQVHMPLIVRGQDFPEGAKIDSQVGNIDIVPTILKYFDLPLPENLGGKPLQDVVSGDGSDDRIIFGEGNNRGPDRKFAVKWPYKCVLDFVNGDIQLYDLEKDPMEANNIAEEFPDIAQGLSKAMVAEMLPSENSFHMWIVAKPGEEARIFTGTLRIPGGIKSVHPFSIGPDDEVSTNGDTVTFRMIGLKSNTEIDKHLIIIPNEGSDTIIADVMVDGKIAPDRFYPYGTLTAEPSGHAEVKIEQFPLGSDLSTAMAFVPSSCFLWGVKGFTREEKRVQLSDEDIEQLKALGYVH